MKEAWRENDFLPSIRQQSPVVLLVLRYGVAAGSIAAAMGLRLALEKWIGPGLPTYITFYPAIMVVALLAGIGPGLLATVLAGLSASYWILPPEGFSIASPVEQMVLVIFIGMGLFMSVVAELYRRTRHKAAAYDREEALRENRERLAMFAQATFEGIIESEAGRIVDCNEQFARMSGYPLLELMGMEIATLIAPEDLDRVMENIRQFRESEIEHAMLRKDGTRIVVEAHGRPLSPGSAKRHTAVRDITERKQTEEALRKSHELLIEMGKIANVGGWEFDMETLELQWTEEVYHIHEVELSYKPTVSEAIDFYAPNSRPVIAQAVQRAIEFGEPFDLNLEIITAKGNHRWVHAIGKADRELKIVNGTFQDITKRKKAEADIIKLSNDLETRNMDLEEANKDLELFIYSVSHDLRAPIRHMSSFAKFLLEDYAGKLDDQGQDYVRRINLGSEKMGRLVDDLLELSRLSRQATTREEVDMSALAASIISGLREADPGRSVEITIEGGLTASADPSLTEIVLSNLIGNAWKFTSKTAKATIEFGAMDKDGKTVYYVRDNGAGFDPNYQKEMFLPFHRLHSDQEFEGTGIGLSIVERIIRRHGGKVWAAGEVEKGATVYFTLG